MAVVTRRSFTQYDPADGLTGFFVPDLPGFDTTASGVLLTASRTYYIRFRPKRNRSIIKIKFCVLTGATANDNVDCGIMDSTGAKLVSSGATAGQLNTSNTNGSVTVASTALVAGTTYYAALSCGTVGGTAATLVMCNPAGGANSPLGDIAGTTIGSRVSGIQASQATVPTQATLAQGTQVPLLWLSEV